VLTSVLDGELVELRAQTHYWRAMHARASEREAFWKEKAQKLETTNREQGAQINQLLQEKEKLKARIAWLEQQLFGRKSERRNPKGAEKSENDPGAADSSEDTSQKKRKRGKQPGTKGHGRKHYDELLTEETIHELPEGERRCPRCGKPFCEFPGTEDSQEIHWEFYIFRRIHRRKRYIPTCNCNAVPGIVTAPPPPKLIPKGLFSTGFWIRLLLEKFLFRTYRNCICQLVFVDNNYFTEIRRVKSNTIYLACVGISLDID